MKPTKAHSSQEGQRRPTKRKQGPNDASGVVWALGVFFLIFLSVLLTTTAPNDADTSFGPFHRTVSICPHHHQRVSMTRWWLPRLPSGLTTTDESLRLIGQVPRPPSALPPPWWLL